MGAITLDIATRFLGAAEDMYIIRPGENFSLYRDFLQHRAVFLDFPDIRLDFEARPTRDALRQAVVRSMAMREWHRGGHVGASPSRDPSDYLLAAHGRRLGRYVAAIHRLYYGLRAGTIIVVPGPGYFSDVLIGELVGPPLNVGNIALYPGEFLPARRVRWIGRRAKAQFGPLLRDRLAKPTPLMVIDRSVRHEILEAAFDQYSIGNEFSSRLTTTEEDFSTLDDYNIQTFLNYVSGVLAAVEEGAAFTNMNMAAALEMLKQHRELVPELTANINSPGALRLFHSKLLPITVALLFALAASGSAAMPDALHVVNSAVAGDDPCALLVQEQAMAAIKMMDIGTWHQVCVQARDAAESTGLSTSIKIIPNADSL